MPAVPPLVAFVLFGVFYVTLTVTFSGISENRSCSEAWKKYEEGVFGLITPVLVIVGVCLLLFVYWTYSNESKFRLEYEQNLYHPTRQAAIEEPMEW